MKGVLFVFAVSVLAITCFSKTVYDKEVWRARDNGAEFDVMFRVVDDEGFPVANARCGGWMYIEHDNNHGCGYAVHTDTNGCARVIGKCSEWFSVVVRKEGYYKTSFDVKYPLENVASPIVCGKWQPYGETRIVVLKKITNPIKMVMPSSRIDKTPSLGKWYGYDLVCRDWMPPYGEGTHLDFFVRLGLDAVNDTSDFRATMDICFTNAPWSGVYRMPKDAWSEMKSSYLADTNAVYKSSMSFEFEQHPHRPIRDTRLSEKEYLVFRIRTKVDDQGRLISAHYGKINGPWTFFGAMTVGEVLFNSTPNDPNLEDAETARKSRLGYKQHLEFERQRKAGGK